MKTVAFYSYKGGVGRTLLVANTAQFLAMSGRRVVALDLDLEAPGLHQKLGSGEVLRAAREGTLKGAVDLLLESLERKPRYSSLDEVAVEVEVPSDSGGSLRLIPAGAAPSQAYWTALEKLTGSLRSSGRDGGLPEAVLELQARIAEELSPDFLLIDSRTGITELGGLATSLLADRVVFLSTTTAESLEGMEVVALALLNAPRLSSQTTLQLDFVFTRVTSVDEARLKKLVHPFGGSLAVFPHDPGIAHREHLIADWRASQIGGCEVNEESQGNLLSATLDWIATSFPGHKQEAEKTRRRMKAVHNTWQCLTRSGERASDRVPSRSRWPVGRLHERVRFYKGVESRMADIVALSDGPEARMLMVIEYVEGEDRAEVARWWVTGTGVQVVVILAAERRWLYSQAHLWSLSARPAERLDLPMPYDFEALADPVDASIEAMLDAVQRGYTEYLDRLIGRWVFNSGSPLYGFLPWKPHITNKILDGLAPVDDIDLAKRILLAVHSVDGERVSDQVRTELFAPLLWRLPAAATVEFMHRNAPPWSPPIGQFPIGLLARDTLGLTYDPGATFRSEAQRTLAVAGGSSRELDDKGLLALAAAFETSEISFSISSEVSPLAEFELSRSEGPGGSKDLQSLISKRIASGTMVTTGLLGNYLPHLGRVILYEQEIALTADKLSLRARHVGSVTLIHETLHALVHLGRDLDGRMWPEFALPSPDTPFFEPSWFHESVSQYFTHLHLVRLKDPDLLHAFEVLSAKQVPAYRTWERMRHIPAEEIRAWFLSVRRGAGAGGPAFAAIVDALRPASP